MIKYIDGYTNYLISDTGYVKSIKKDYILMFDSGSKRHKRVTLSKNGTSKKFLIHRLVAQHFMTNPENKEQIHHIDNDTSNNNVQNLMWVTAKEHNDIHGYANLENYNNRNKKKVDMYKINGKFVKSFDSMGECAKYILVERGKEITPNRVISIRSSITKICRGAIGTKSLYGYTWKYKEEE